MVIGIGVAVAVLYSGTGKSDKERKVKVADSDRCLTLCAVPSDAVLVASYSGADMFPAMKKSQMAMSLHYYSYDYVKPVSDDMRAYNTVGVALMMQGQFEEAMPWFVKALEGNCPTAQQNIDAINAEYAYEAEQRAAIEEYLSKYE